MSVVAIVVIAVVVVAILIALGVLMPRIRERGRVMRQERELGQRRKQVISEQREQADAHVGRAEAAEQRARIAEQEARRERAAADLRREHAELHERGMADHELIEEHERDQFTGTSAVPNGHSGGDGNEAVHEQAADGQASPESAPRR
jgi:biopolymer transport protein ExbB/TolQ